MEAGMGAERGDMVEFTYVVRGAEGLHARPVATIAAEARMWESEITVTCGERHASARDLMGLMALDARHGDELTVSIAGRDEDAAAASLRTAFDF